jgi:hypothetical protein
MGRKTCGEYSDVLDLEGDEIAASKFAIDGQIEHRQVARLSLDLQLGPDRPEFGRSGGFAPISLPLFKGTRLSPIVSAFL